MSKQQDIISMFDNIASTYDTTNRVISFGIDQNWREKACLNTFILLQKTKIGTIVDVACGTGDMLLAWQKLAKEKNIHVGKYLGIDPSSNMLNIAKKKVLNSSFMQAGASCIPAEDVDIISISYGLRNVVHRAEALKEFYDTLIKGGLLVVLEFTKSDQKSFVSSLRGFYMNKVLPFMGGVLSKNFKAYRYLPNSIDDFITTQELCSELEHIGFKIEYSKGDLYNMSTTIIARKA